VNLVAPKEPVNLVAPKEPVNLVAPKEPVNLVAPKDPVNLVVPKGVARPLKAVSPKAQKQRLALRPRLALLVQPVLPLNLPLRVNSPGAKPVKISRFLWAV
jgi:hypothetical protein